jgi:hypothetical protein
MYTLQSIAKTLRTNGINIVSENPSTDWQLEDDEITLNNQIYLQIGEDYIGVYRDNGSESVTQLGYYEEITYSLIYKLITLTK